MRTCLLVAAALALTAAGAAKDFVNEDFEGAFPPAGWTTAYEGNGSGRWSRASDGPWGCYAYGSASSAEAGLVRAIFMSPQFNVKANTKTYYRFDYGHFDNGHGVGGAEFYVACVDPPGADLVYTKLEVPPKWVERAGDFSSAVDRRVKACWRVWADCYWRYHYSFLFFDNAIISDEKRYPGVAPTSLGRVKALFR